MADIPQEAAPVQEAAPQEGGGGIEQVAASLGQGLDALAGAAQQAGAPEEIIARFSAVKTELGDLIGMLTGAEPAQEPVGTTGQSGVSPVASPEGRQVSPAGV